MSATASDSNSANPRPVKKGDHVFLIDGSGYIFRAYHALPPLTRPSDGLPVGAVHGFCNMLWKLLRDANDEFEPTHFAVIFDYSGKSFRNDIYPEYKAHRPPPPEDLIPQFSIIRDATRAFNVACIEKEGYEADDLIATYARQAVEAGCEVTIVSSDKDLMQMVGPNIEINISGTVYGPDGAPAPNARITLAMDGGAIHIAARASSGGVRVSITDRGAAISGDDRDRVFQAFRSTTSASGRRIGGMGLSLSLARSLVRAHGGEVQYDASVTAGTTFHVLIPTDGPS